MVTIRAQENGAASKTPERQAQNSGTIPQKRKSPESKENLKAKEPRWKQEETESHPVLAALLAKHDSAPLAEIGISNPHETSSSTMMTHLLNALLTSARISDHLATKSVKCLIEENYHDISTLRKSTWEKRTEVLTRGGYTRYREKTATFIGELVQLLTEQYDGDLNKLRSEAGDDPDEICRRLKEVIGMSEVGVNVFCDTAQGVWTCLAPFVDPKNEDVTKKLGPSGTDNLWNATGRNAKELAKASSCDY